jgi:hypothetical protein
VLLATAVSVSLLFLEISFSFSDLNEAEEELDVLIFRMIAPLIFRHALRHLILYELCNIVPIGTYIIYVLVKLFLHLVTYAWSDSA